MKSYNGFTPAERMKGDRIIKKAISEGKLEPPTECIFCGQKEGILHYHCEDYTPETILENCMCMCWRCHMILHSRYRNREAFDKYIEEISNGKRYPPVYKHDFRILSREHNI